MKCPNCEETLVLADRQGIEIDYCPKCRGVWLDKGELDKIIEKSELSSPKSYDNDRKEEHYDDGFDKRRDYDKSHQHRKKRGGFLSNLFEFD
ncbi:MAG: TFIIB-type zinc ribbon-containing protein [Flavisolibacter sp.]